MKSSESTLTDCAASLFSQQRTDLVLEGKAERALDAIALLTMCVGMAVHGYALEHMFLAAVGLALAAIPEGLPAIIRAVVECRSAGIRVKMITGDHLTTARAVGAAMKIGDGHKAVLGEDLQALNDADLQSLVETTDVFARSSPEHKLRIVEALQARGHVVSMTGDGVNDAPALKRADVGVAMGRGGTEVARQAAEMVLSDDNFASIESAVEEGRAVYDNIRKAILFILPTNAA